MAAASTRLRPATSRSTARVQRRRCSTCRRPPTADRRRAHGRAVRAMCAGEMWSSWIDPTSPDRRGRLKRSSLTNITGQLDEDHGATRRLEAHEDATKRTSGVPAASGSARVLTRHRTRQVKEVTYLVGVSRGSLNRRRHRCAAIGLLVLEPVGKPLANA